MRWDLRTAIKNLDITMVPMQPGCGSRGTSIEREVAINPNERYPEFVAIHEMAHILLGHTIKKPGDWDNPTLQEMRALVEKIFCDNMNEVEAHGVAITTAGMLGIDFDHARELKYLDAYIRLAGEVPGERKNTLGRVAAQIYNAGL